jgi:subtilase family serine protease
MPIVIHRSDSAMISMLTSIFPATSPDASRRIFSPSQKRSTLFTLCVALLFTILGQAQQSPQVLHNHVRSAVSRGQAALVGRVLATQKMQVSIVLPLRNQTALTGLLGQLYDPSSQNYRHFLSVDQFTEQFSPTAEDYQAVVDFAKANGLTVSSIPANRLVVPVNGTVAQVEKAFNVRMNNYQHPTEKRTFFSPDREPSLDLPLAIGHIAGLNNFSIPHSLAVKANSSQRLLSAAIQGSGPGGAYIASDMRAAYYGNGALNGAGQTLGLLEFDGYNLDDVNLTFSNTGQTYDVPINNVLLDGATGAPVSGSDVEQVLDIVQAIGMAPGLSQIRVYIGSSDVDILNAIASENLAQEVSISWTWTPDDPQTDDIFFQEMAAQGQSAFAASGDYGAYRPDVPLFYPAEDAYVTTVGGSSLVTTGEGGQWASETGWSDSGGGVSPDGVQIPVWQAGVANTSNLASGTLRNVPDVTMEADFDNYTCNMGTCEGGWGGTSFAAPRWAAYVALANQQAVEAGDTAVGFLNPVIYPLAEGPEFLSDFHDITSGQNGYPYYNAVSGYDLVTGWGSPNGQNLINVLAPLSPPSFKLTAALGSLTINPGASGSATINIVSANGFSGNINLSVSGLPAGVAVTWSANPANVASSLTLVVSDAVVRGSYLVTVTGTSGSLSASTTLALLINAPGFSIAPAQASAEVISGTSSSISFAVTDYGGFNGNVTFAVNSSLPSGVTATWNNNPSNGTTQLILTGSPSMMNGKLGGASSQLTVTGTSGTLTASATLSIMMFPSSILMSIQPAPTFLLVGSSLSATVTVNCYGICSADVPVSLSAPLLPSGVTATFNPSMISPGQSSVLTLSADPTAQPGLNMLTEIEAQSQAGYAYAGFYLNVTATPASYVDIALEPASLTLSQGSSTSGTITVTENGFSGPVSLTANNLPAGIAASFSPASTTGSSTLTLSSDLTIATGLYYFFIDSSAPPSGGAGGSEGVYLVVTPSPGFTLTASPSSEYIQPGTSKTTYISVTPQSGFNGSVAFSVAGLPSGVTAQFSPASSATGSALTLTAASTAVPGSYSVVVAGASGAQTSTFALPLIIGSNTNFGPVNIGVASPLAPITVTFQSQQTLASIAVLTQGAAGLDFNDAGSDTCAPGSTYTAGQSCTVNVIFTPRFSGTRYGAVVLTDTTGTQVSAAYLQGTGIGPQITFAPGSVTSFTSGITWPVGVAVDGSGNIFFSQLNQSSIFELQAINGTVPASAAPTALASVTGQPYAIAVDGAGNVFFTTFTGSTVYELTRADNFATMHVVATGFNAPLGIAVDGYGNVYVADEGSNAVYQIPFGCTEIGCAQVLGSGFVYPEGIAVDANGNVFVGDWGNQAVKEVTAASNYTTVNTLMTGVEDPSALAVDGQGNVFVLDEEAGSISEIVAAGGYTTIEAIPGFFPNPWGLALAPTGNLYVSNFNTGISFVDIVDSPSVAFASAAVGSTSSDSPRTVTVENVGNAALNFSAVGYPSSFPESSQETTDCTATTSLPSNGSCTLTIDFSPLTAGALSDSLVLTDNALNVTSATQSISLSGTATPAPSFTISASPASLAVVQGNSGTSTIAMTGQNGFTGSVTLAASGLPNGVTAAFGTNPTTGSSVLTLTASGTAATGTATVMIEGTSGSLTASTTVALTVNPAPSFTLGASPSSLTVVQGTSGTSTIAVTGQNGFTGSVTLAATGLSSGVTAAFATNPTTGSSVLTLTASSTATVGTATVTITGTSGSLTASTTVALTINPAPSFTLSDSPGSLTVVQGKSGTSTVTVTAVNGFTGSVTLAASGLPSGVTAAFGTNPTTGSSVLTLTASSTATVGTATITIKGTSGSLTATTTLSLTIPAPSFTLTDSPGSLTVVQGKSGTSTVTVTAVNGFTGSVTLAASGLPSGVTAAFGTNPTTGSSVLTLTASSTATVGTATITIKGTSGSLTATTTLSLTVTAAPSFTISASPTSLTIVQRRTGTSTITITSQNGFNSATTLSATGLPKGVTASFSANPVTPKANGSATSTLTLTASSSATTGAVTVTVTGVSGSLTQNTTIALTVNK